MAHVLEGLRSEPDPRDPRASDLLLRDATNDLGGRRVLLGLPYDGGIPSRPGARFGPRAIREALGGFGVHDGERDLNPVVDLGDVTLPAMNGAEAHRRIEESARRVYAAGANPVFLGGDHGCTGSVIRGLASARPGLRLAVITIDAHLDVREYDDEKLLSSGTPFRRAIETPIVEGTRVAMIGLRPYANSRYYLDWAREQDVHLYGVDDVAARGASDVAREAVSRAGDGADAVYLSIDLDAGDAAVAPGVSAVGAGGLSAREMIDMVRAVAGDQRLIGADIMELSPPYDQDGRTAKLATRLLLELIGAAG
jgi:formimidoylglutamase